MTKYRVRWIWKYQKKSTVYIKIFHPGQYEDSSKADCDKDTKEHYQSAENDQVS